MVLATGGFERNAAMRRAVPAAVARAALERLAAEQHRRRPSSPPTRIGAATLNMDSAWWGTSMSLPGEERARLMAFERALPGAIIVNDNGERYMNEAASYHVAGQQMLRHDAPQRAHHSLVHAVRCHLARAATRWVR